MISVNKFFLIVLLLQASPIVLAQSDVVSAARANRARVESKRDDDSEWYKATRVSLRAQEQGSVSTTTYEISGSQELKITMDAKGKQGQQETGEIMLINGQSKWMLAKNVPFEKGYEIDALDGPVLELKLVLELLRAAAPGGPNEIRKRTTFNVDDKPRPISVNTASASGGIEAPWTLQATIEPITTDQWSFELTVKHDETVHMNGTWQKEAAPPVFGDDIS